MFITKDEFRDRYERVLKATNQTGFDLLLVYTRGNRNMYGNLLYLTGYYSFDPCIEGALVINKNGDADLLSNFEWDLDRAALTSWLPRRKMHYTRNLGKGLVDFTKNNNLANTRIGLVGDTYLPISLFSQLQTNLPEAEFVPATELVERERMIKSVNELAAMREAARITNLAIMAGTEALKKDLTELDIFAICVRTMLENQADEVAFTPQVSFGKNTEVCMGPPTTNRLQPGDMVQFDMGCLYDHYVGDLSRSFVFGKPTSDQKGIYDLVVKAQDAAISAVRPGIKAGDIDKIARDIISEAGYGECFNHWLGRGEGLDLHEKPFVEEGDELVLAPGMVFSVEPGIYLPGLGGSRLEETVAVTDDGYEVISERSWMPFSV